MSCTSDIQKLLGFTIPGDGLVEGAVCLYFLGALAVLCEDYLIPSVSQMAKKLKRKHSETAASFIAMGTAIPEILLCSLSVAHDIPEAGSAIVLGSTLFKTLVTFSIVPFFAATIVRVRRDTIVRDFSFLLLVCVYLLVVLKNQPTVTAWSACILLGIYGLYAVTVTISTQSPMGSRHRCIPNARTPVQSTAESRAAKLKAREKSERRISKSVSADGITGLRSETADANCDPAGDPLLQEARDDTQHRVNSHVRSASEDELKSLLRASQPVAAQETDSDTSGNDVPCPGQTVAPERPVSWAKLPPVSPGPSPSCTPVQTGLGGSPDKRRLARSVPLGIDKTSDAVKIRVSPPTQAGSAPCGSQLLAVVVERNDVRETLMIPSELVSVGYLAAIQEEGSEDAPPPQEHTALHSALADAHKKNYGAMAKRRVSFNEDIRVISVSPAPTMITPVRPIPFMARPPEPPSPSSDGRTAATIVRAPLSVLFCYVLPDPKRTRTTWRLLLLNAATVAYMLLFSWVIIKLVMHLVCITQFPAEFFGATLVAVGAGVPTLISAVVLASSGAGSEAYGAVMGDNILASTVGLGLPWLASSLLGHPVSTDTLSVQTLAWVLAAGILLPNAVLLMGRGRVSVVNSFFLLLSYIFFLAVFIVSHVLERQQHVPAH